MKDELLIKRIRAGDEDAAEELVRRYYIQVMRFCRWQCGIKDLAEDMTQETFFKVFRSLNQYRQRGHFKTWLFCIDRSVCIDELRKRKFEYEPDYDICEVCDEHDGIKHMEIEDEIRWLLSGLPDEQKEAMILHYMEGFSYREIGEILNIPYRTVQSRVNLAIKTLRQKGENRLLNDPRILILDEPTAGLDPKERVRFRNLLLSLARDRIVILSTHIVSDIEAIADRVFVMKRGQFVSQGNIRELLAEVQGHVWELAIDPAETEKWEEETTVANLRREDHQTILRVISEESPGAGAVRIQATLEDLYLYYFPTERS